MQSSGAEQNRVMACVPIPATTASVSKHIWGACHVVTHSLHPRQPLQGAPPSHSHHCGHRRRQDCDHADRGQYFQQLTAVERLLCQVSTNMVFEKEGVVWCLIFLGQCHLISHLHAALLHTHVVDQQLAIVPSRAKTMCVVGPSLARTKTQQLNTR
jgi:hypothetical protein